MCFAARAILFLQSCFREHLVVLVPDERKSIWPCGSGTIRLSQHGFKLHYDGELGPFGEVSRLSKYFQPGSGGSKFDRVQEKQALVMI